uniref:Alpha-galactosidase n=1 Tax=Ascaris lumbricoides TaxID=6252 RepID=A0A0M3I8L3_ASCLU
MQQTKVDLNKGWCLQEQCDYSMPSKEVFYAYGESLEHQVNGYACGQALDRRPRQLGLEDIDGLGNVQL